MFGNRLRELRRQRGMKQQELAELLEISASAVGMYEQGRREPDHMTIAKLCRIFGVSSDCLLLDKAPPAQMQSQKLEDILDDFRSRLLSQEGLMFNGVPLTESDIAQVMSAIEVGTMVAVNRLDNRKKISGE